jgi:AcrR family transcriptional regulator
MVVEGALYHHFDSKEALATAIIEQGTNLTRDAFRHVCQSSSPHSIT